MENHLAKSQVKLISESRIKPKNEIEQSKHPHYLLGPGDLLHLSTQYMQFADRLATVKHEDEHACWIYVDCHNGPGARFVHGTAVGGAVPVANIVSYSPVVLPIVRSFFDLGERAVINYYDAVVNHLGLKIGVFMNVTISQAPIFEPIYPYGYGTIIKLLYSDPDELLTFFNMELQLSERFFHFLPASLAKLKVRVNVGFNDESNTISSVQALSALVWRSMTQA
ncbi:hypothetical protein Cgig2_002888 [Carnegiea gigantea]|uniref:Uncharacterized protein n=1 Tax=Carnegiea gigantea TaxID=171969 RepID=A0A9Q1KLL6_9CARY|nr:hypothetical protein Cgig2_002888 [Carnegiea gigantea]